MNDLVALISRINTIRQELNALNLVKKVNRCQKWQENYNKLHQSYKDSLQEIKIGKIRETYLTNHIEIKKAKDGELINKQQFSNFMYNNKISKVRDLHPVFYVIKDNKVYFIVQTSQNIAVPKPLQDELEVNVLNQYIPVIEVFKGKYAANVIYVIEAKNTVDLLNIVEDIEQNALLKIKYLNNLDEYSINEKKEKAFEFFYKVLLNQDVALTNNNSEYIDITFDKYLLDNIDRISFYEKYRQESLTAYLKLYEPDNIEFNYLIKKNEDI